MSDPREQPEAQGTGSTPSSGSAGAAAGGEAAGDVIGHYELLEELGQGGMGTVWLAQQSEPVKRRVALKIIKLGMDTREVVARFEVERQALALMDHPHIAKVLDAGATEGGRPYFVMEHVQGAPITTFCDQAGLDLRARLELFNRVCLAIQHAHHKGIIHRDVKPSNVLVSSQDGVPQPKVIDFGIAKATAELGQAASLTRHAQVIGTPECMAPEQAESGGLDIDTRADIYSLGVLLYELLTGTKPIVLEKGTALAYAEALRAMREQEPDRPSTRLTNLGERAGELAALRQMELSDLQRGLRGDLDWIVMKALEKDRSRRYETANALAADIEHYLCNEPVEAAPPSTRYRLGKLLRRRKRTVLLLGTIGFLIVAGSVGTGIGWWRLVQAGASLEVALDEQAEALRDEQAQRGLAEASEERARQATSAAEGQAERARLAEESQRARAVELEQVAAFQAAQLSGLDVELMGRRLQRAVLAAAPEEHQQLLRRKFSGVNFTDLALGSLRENLFDRTIETIDEQFAEQPSVQAQLLQASASTLRSLGMLELAQDPQQRALEMRQRSLGAEHPDTLASQHDLGLLRYDQGQFAAAGALFEAALEGSRRALGDQHPSTLNVLGSVAGLLHTQGEQEAAEARYREVLAGLRDAEGEARQQYFNMLSNLASLLQDRGQLEEAEALCREALEGKRSTLGNAHANTLLSIHNLASLMYARGNPAGAIELYREALEGLSQGLGEEHPVTLKTMSNLGALLKEAGQLEEAETLQLIALEGRERVLGPDHADTLESLNNLGTLRFAQGQVDESEALFRQVVEGLRRVMGGAHPSTLRALNSLAFVLQNLGRLDEAEAAYREALAGLRRGLGDLNPATLSAINNLGFLLFESGRFEELEPLYREAYEGRRQTLGDAHPDTQQSGRNLELLLQQRLERARAAGDEYQLGLRLSALGSFRLSQGAHGEAQELLGDALGLLFPTAAEDDPAPWQAQLELGLAQAGQGRFLEAEALLLESARWIEEAEREELRGPVLRSMRDFYAAWQRRAPSAAREQRAGQAQAAWEAWSAQAASREAR